MAKKESDSDVSDLGDEADEVSLEGLANNDDMKNNQRGAEKIPPTVILQNGSDIQAYLKSVGISGIDVENVEIKTKYQI
jgi:hypothetical protein